MLILLVLSIVAGDAWAGLDHRPLAHLPVAHAPPPSMVHSSYSQPLYTHLGPPQPIYSQPAPAASHSIYSHAAHSHSVYNQPAPAHPVYNLPASLQTIYNQPAPVQAVSNQPTPEQTLYNHGLAPQQPYSQQPTTALHSPTNHISPPMYNTLPVAQPVYNPTAQSLYQQYPVYPNILTSASSHASSLQNNFLPPPVSYSSAYSDYSKNVGQQSVQSTYQSAQSVQPVVHTSLNYNQNVEQSTNALPVSNSKQSSASNSIEGYSSSYSNVQSAQPVHPVITKHIYFHVPPPDVEELPAPLPLQAPSQKYNIVFIKVPNQEHENAVKLQNLLQNQVQDKTLIYVLVKKPESAAPVQVPAESPDSKPEVFYVKYKGGISGAAAQIAGKTQLQATPATSTVLQPQLINVNQQTN